MKFSVMLKNWKTTLMGVFPAILGTLVAFGVIDLEQNSAIIDGVSVAFDTADTLVNEIVAAIAYFAAIIGLFSKDGDKSSEEVGIK